VVRDQLISLGFTVLEAGDADEAEQLIRSLPDIEGLVSDIDMPGRLNGFGLAELMREQDSNNTIILISGNALHQQSGETGQPWNVLPKPFDRDALAAAIRTARTSQGNNP